MRRLMTLMVCFQIFSGGVSAEVFQLETDLKIVLPQLAAPWSASTEPPPAMVEHLVEHVLEEAAQKGTLLSTDQARQVALKRAMNNQLFVANEDSGAHLLISFSRLEKDETAPSAKTVAQSAQYALESVADEGWSVISRRQATTVIKGAEFAQWVSIEYTQDEEHSLFNGIVGFASPYWFWFYATDHLKNPHDQKFLEGLLLKIGVQVAVEKAG